MKKFFAAMVLAGLVAVPMTFAQETQPAPSKTEKSKKKSAKKKAPKKQEEEKK